MKTRKIIQIETWEGQSVALCSDGTLWKATFKHKLDEANLSFEFTHLEWEKIGSSDDLKG